MKRRKYSLNPYSEAILLNNLTFDDYFRRLSRIALSIFEWRNLPKTMDARYLELSLFMYGKASLLYDEKFGFVNTKCACNGGLNIYGLPTSLNCYSYGYNTARKTFFNKINEKQKTSDAILVFNNLEHTNTGDMIELFAHRLAESERTCDVNLKNVRTPVVILTTETNKVTMQRLYEQFDGNSPVIFPNKEQYRAEDFKTFKTDAEFIALDVKDYQTRIWNEALTSLGINNLQEKRERLIRDETSSNNEAINMNLQAMLAPREKACAQFNELFKPKEPLEVRVRSDLDNIVKKTQSTVTAYEDNENIKLGESEGE